MGSAAGGFAAVLLLVALAVAIDPTALGDATSATNGTVATGNTTEVTVTAKDMRFTPDHIDMPTGDHLIIKLLNADDTQVHDLVLDTGHTSGRLSPGESATIDVGVVGRDLGGWCSVIGHRRMGMTMQINTIGRDSASADSAATRKRVTLPIPATIPRPIISICPPTHRPTSCPTIRICRLPPATPHTRSP
ncbi:MAG: cupredoxin domain-containing protein [Cumulibacter sp.]